MNNISLDLSEKVDANLVTAIADVSETAAEFDIPFLIVGATARDLLLEYACGIATGRATEDVDFGVQVESWDHYEMLISGLEDRAGFVRDRRKRHRLQGVNSVMIDLVPFGPIAGSENKIVWPPDGEQGMSVEGFESALANAVEVLLRIDPRLVVRVASLPTLAMLKILSWDEAYPERARDGYDFYIIMNTYMETPNLDRLSSDAPDLVVEPIPPLQEIGARLLGRDMAHISDASTATKLMEILRREQSDTGPLRLLPAMMEAAGASTTADEVLALLRAVERGFSDVVQGR
jgi:predicted nucleotidyltransferase